MFDDLAALFHESLVATLEEYLRVKDSGKAGLSKDLRAALNAAVALYHFREHLPTPTTPQMISQKCTDYNLLADAVNAFKHGKLTKPQKRPRQIVDTQQIQERVIVTEYQDDQGKYNHIDKAVVLKLVDGTERDLLSVFVNVMNFWQEHLYNLGVIPKRAPYNVPIDSQPKTRAECQESRLDLEAIQGVRFKQMMCLRRYNYASGTVEPVNLTGSQLQFRIYKPRYDVELTAQNQTSGKQFTRTVSLSAEENEHLAKLRTDAEKQQYLTSLAGTQDAFKELVNEIRASKET